jgi:hypothetical protein
MDNLLLLTTIADRARQSIHITTPPAIVLDSIVIIVINIDVVNLPVFLPSPSFPPYSPTMVL